MPTTQTSRSRWRVVVGRTLPVSWWTDRLRPLGAPGNRGHPCSFLWGNLSVFWVIPEAQYLLRKGLAIGYYLINWWTQLHSGGGSIVGGEDDLWAVGGGDGQVATGVTQVGALFHCSLNTAWNVSRFWAKILGSGDGVKAQHWTRLAMDIVWCRCLLLITVRSIFFRWPMDRWW